MPDVIITYKGETIATMSESGSKTAQTSGKYCEGDIVVQYTKPEGSAVGDYSAYQYSDVQTSDATLMTVTNPLGVMPKLITFEALSAPEDGKIGKGVFTPDGGYCTLYNDVTTSTQYVNYPTESLSTVIRSFVISSESLQARRCSAGMNWDTSVTYRFKFYA